jgi:glycosyltransferase involved in cell wall biosynthesis
MMWSVDGVDPEVSVVMGVYNGGQELRRTLDSILAQTGVDFELVVVDDGSTDSSGALLDETAAQDSRVRVIHQENRGLTGALIAGCAAARGRYIARHDCGDTSAPRRLALQKQLLDDNSDLVFVSCWTAFVGPGDEPLYESRGTGAASSPIDILDPTRQWGVIDGPTSHPSVMMRRDAYHRAGAYRAAFAVGQDWDLWYRLAAIGKFQILPETLYTAAVTPGSISAGSRHAQQEMAALSRAAMLARLRGESDDEIVARAAAVRIVGDHSSRGKARGFYSIAEALRRKGDARARGYFRQAIALHPTFLKAWIRYAQSFF